MTTMYPPDGAPRQITDFELALAGPGGAALARTVLSQLDQMALRIERQLRTRSPLAVYEQLLAANDALQAARATMLTANQVNRPG